MKHINLIIMSIISLLLCFLITSCSTNEPNATTYIEDPDNTTLAPVVDSNGKIIIDNCIEISFSENDYNGYAEPDYFINEEKLNSLIKSEIINSFNTENALILGWERYELSDLLEIEFSEDYDNLSNGDKVILKIKPDGLLEEIGIKTLVQLEAKLNIKFSSDTIEYTVSGLKNASDIIHCLDEFVNVDFGVYNGYGTPTPSINEENLNKTINRKLYNAYVEKQDGELKSALKKISKYNDLFEVTLNEAYNYSSDGDKVYFSIKPCKELANLGVSISDLCQGICFNLDKTESYKTVEGLKEPGDTVLIDTFKNFDNYMVFEGVNGKGTATLNFTDFKAFNINNCYVSYKDSFWNNDYFSIIFENKEILTYSYKIDSSTDSLKKGMVISVSVNADTEKLKDLNYDIASLRYNFLIDDDDLGEYLTPDELKKDNVIKKVQELFMNRDKSAREIGNFYFATVNPGVVYNYDQKYSLTAMIYSDNGWYDDYYLITLYDVYMYSDGTISGTFKKTTSIADSFEELEKSLSSNYTYVKIKNN